MHTYVYNRYATIQLKLMRNMHILQKNMIVKRKRLYLYLVNIHTCKNMKGGFMNINDCYAVQYYDVRFTIVDG